MKTFGTTLLMLLLSAAAACDAREPYCRDSIFCVETCGDTAEFRACGMCPEGSVEADSCSAVDAGASTDGG